jgi:hypothetical protein
MLDQFVLAQARIIDAWHALNLAGNLNGGLGKKIRTPGTVAV